MPVLGLAVMCAGFAAGGAYGMLVLQSREFHRYEVEAEAMRRHIVRLRSALRNQRDLTGSDL